MNFQHLRFAIAVAETASFTQAADICCVTQPALSNAIGQLEDELGGKLFERTTRSVTTTDFGKIMIEKMLIIVEARLNLLTCAADHLARDDMTVHIGISPLISEDFSKTMLARAKQSNLSIILRELNKADIGPALQSGTIDFGLFPAPHDETKLCSMAIYSEPLFFISDKRTQAQSKPPKLAELSKNKFLLVPDDCGLSETVRILFRNESLDLDEYEGRALGYHVLEKWAHMGIGVTLLPASHVSDTDFACPIKTEDGNFAMIPFVAQWTSAQETRTSFKTILNCLGNFEFSKTSQMPEA